MRRSSRDEALDLMRDGLATFLEGALRVAGGVPKVASANLSARVAKTWRDELLAGYRQDPASILSPLRSRPARDLVAARDLEFTSTCRHHLLPFTGRVHLAYAPAGRITGLSRLGRLVDCLSRRLQLQETLTREIAAAIQRHLIPEGAACVIEATHACMTMRGARKTRSVIVTAAFTGVYRANASRRREVLALLGYTGSRRAS